MNNKTKTSLPASFPFWAIVFSVFLLLPAHLAAQLIFRLGDIYEDAGRDIAVDQEGNVYLVGTFQGNIDMDPGVGISLINGMGDPSVSTNLDIFLVKYDDQGQLQWAFSIGSDGMDMVYDLELDRQGHLYITGFIGGTADMDPSSQEVLLFAGTGADAFVASYDTSGNYRWARVMGSPELPPFDPVNPRYEEGFDLDVDAAGNIYLTGVFDGFIDFDADNGSPFDTFVSVNDSAGSPSQDIFVVSYATNGNYRWGFALGGPGEDRGQALVLNRTGGFALAGFFSDNCDMDPSGLNRIMTSNGKTDAFLAEYQTVNGVMNWAISWGGSEIDFVSPGALDAGSSGTWMVGGQFREGMDMNPASGTAMISSQGDGDMFVAAYSGLGEYLWAWPLGGLADDAVQQVKAGPDDEIFVSGWLMGSVDVDPGQNTDMRSTVSSGGASDIFLGKFDADGQYIWANLYGGGGVDSTQLHSVPGMTVDSSGSVFVCGQFYGTGDFDPAADLVSLSSMGKGDFFTAKYDPWGYLWTPATAQDPSFAPSEVYVFPNPFLDELTISFGSIQRGPFNIELFNFLGQNVYKMVQIYPENNQSLRLNLPSRIQPGVYLLSLTIGNKEWAQRLVKRN